MLVTRRQLNEIINRELSEGFFDTIGDLFKSDETRKAEAEATRASAAEEALRIEQEDRQKIREYYSDYLVLSKFRYVDQNWHQNSAFLCEDTTGKKTLWYQSGRERILVQIAGVGIYPHPPGDELAPASYWLCKSTPLKRPYGGSTEEKIYELLNTFVNNWNSRDALSYPRDLVTQLSAKGQEYFHKYFNEEILKKTSATVENFVTYNAPQKTFSENVNESVMGAITLTSTMSDDFVEGSEELLNYLLKIRALYNNDQHSLETYQKARQAQNVLFRELGYNSSPPSNFDSSWADELY